MMAIAMALSMASVVGYTVPKVRVYNAECQFVSDVPKEKLPAKAELLPADGVCSRPSITWNGQRIWLAPGQLQIDEKPPCITVSDPTSKPRAGTEAGLGTGGAVCIANNP